MHSDGAVERVADWKADLETIHQAAYPLFHDQRIWRDYTALIVEKGVPNSIIFDDRFRWYASSQVIAARRLVDKDPRTVSLANLLAEIARWQSGKAHEFASVTALITEAASNHLGR